MPDFSSHLRRNGTNGTSTTTLPVARDIFFRPGRPTAAAPLGGATDVLTPTGFAAFQFVRMRALAGTVTSAQLVGSSSIDGSAAANQAASERRVHWVEHGLRDTGIVFGNPPGSTSDCMPLGAGRYACGSAHAHAQPDAHDRRVRVLAFRPPSAAPQSGANADATTPPDLEKLLKAPLESASAILTVPALAKHGKNKKSGDEKKPAGSSTDDKEKGVEVEGNILTDYTKVGIEVVLQRPVDLSEHWQFTPGISFNVGTDKFPTFGSEPTVGLQYNVPLTGTQISAIMEGKGKVEFPYDNATHTYAPPTLTPAVGVKVEFTTPITSYVDVKITHEVESEFAGDLKKIDVKNSYTGTLTLTFHGLLSRLFGKKRGKKNKTGT